MPNHNLDAYRVGRDNDKRRRLTDSARAELLACKGAMSQREAARAFGVSRRLVIFIWYPERLEAFRALRRGCWRNYYTTERRREEMRKHRAYKRKLMEGEATCNSTS